MADDAPEKNVAFMRNAFETLRRDGPDACAELLAADVILNLPGLPEPLRGRETWKQGVQSMIDGFSDLRIDIEDIFGGEDKVAVRVRLSGTHDGTFQGIPPTHRSVSFTGIEIYRLADDKIAEEWVAPDTASLMAQISDPAPS